MSAGSQTCTFSDGPNSGRVYSANGKARINGTVVDQGETIKSNIIVDGQMFYIWADGQQQGVKMSMTAANSSEYQSTGVASAVDVNKKVDYDCESWRTDESLFALPAGVEFMDLSAMTEAGTGMR